VNDYQALIDQEFEEEILTLQIRAAEEVLSVLLSLYECVYRGCE
jgi:hypothetical protein